VPALDDSGIFAVPLCQKPVIFLQDDAAVAVSRAFRFILVKVLLLVPAHLTPELWPTFLHDLHLVTNSTVSLGIASS
jgi:hypothetical protein